jgi:formylglycine-generating enzyme required for sulfatase activity
MTIKIDRTIKEIQTFTENLGQGINLTMVLIPPGEFWMGSESEENGHKSNEQPRHKVVIEYPFFMGQYQITTEQWNRVASSMPSVKQDIELKFNLPPEANLPASSVSWLEAQEFCARLFTYTNRCYRLPSEAEWEYACRAGTESPFHFGEFIHPDLATFRNDNSHRQAKAVGISDVTNDFGLYDMHGNLWEWCADHWHDNYEGAPLDGSFWLNEHSSVYALRGGSWDSLPQNCRSASRDCFNLDYHFDFIGFRVAYAPDRNEDLLRSVLDAH